MGRNWLAMIVVGLMICVFTLAPVFPPAWRPVGQGIAGILVVVGLIILALVVLGVAIP